MILNVTFPHTDLRLDQLTGHGVGLGHQNEDHVHNTHLGSLLKMMGMRQLEERIAQPHFRFHE